MGRPGGGHRRRGRRRIRARTHRRQESPRAPNRERGKRGRRELGRRGSCVPGAGRVLDGQFINFDEAFVINGGGVFGFVLAAGGGAHFLSSLRVIDDPSNL